MFPLSLIFNLQIGLSDHDKQLIMHRLICNFNIPQPTHPGMAVKFPSPNCKRRFNAPHVRPAGWETARSPLGLFFFFFFYYLTGKDRFKTICNNILSAKSLINIFSSLVFGSTMTVVYDQSNSPPSATCCQISHPHSGS